MGTGLRASRSAKLLRPALVSGACGLLAAAIGASALLGWHTGNVALVRLLPGLPLMAYLTALCFVLSGLGLAAHAWRRPRACTIACGAAAAALGWGWCLEYAFGWRLGVRTLESRLPLIAGFPPTDPAPAAAACFGLFGIAIVVLGIRIPSKPRRLAVWVCGALAMAPYAMVLGSYASGFMRLDDWNSVHGMAVNTLVGMMLLGFSLLAAQLMGGRRLIDDPLLPWPVFLVVAGAVVIFCLALVTARAKAIRSGAEVRARSLATASVPLINAPLRALKRMKMRWEQRGGMSYEEWKLDADASIRSEKLFLAVEWIDTDWRVAWLRPQPKAPGIIGFDLRTDKRWRAAEMLEHSRSHDTMALSPAIELIEGGSGFLVCYPLFPKEKFDGWLLGVVRVGDLVNSLIEGAGLPGGAVSIFENERLIFGPEPPPKDSGPAWGEATVDFHGRMWRFVVAPPVSTFVGYNLPMVTLVLGLLLAVALAAAVRAFQQTAWKNREIRFANRQLARYANEDYLTGLLNRRHFDERLADEVHRARRAGRPVAVLMADVDYFKRYNDRYGHQAGDECLRRVAVALKAAARRPTDIAGRYGGEEFCAVLAETGAQGAREFAEHFRAAVQALNLPHELNPPGCVTVSAGIAAIDFSDKAAGDSVSEKDLVARADAALYAAKNAGRNTVR